MDHIPHSEQGVPDELKAWLGEQPQEEANALEQAWNLAVHAQQFDLPSEPDTERFGQMREEVLRAAAQEQVHVRTHLRLVSTPILRIAASLVVLVLAGTFLWTRPISHTAPVGDQLSVQLSDGSTVSLNSGSRLVHNRSFGSKNRRVTLKGEAFFDVAHSDTPFIVETFNGTVTVLGTRFNVRAWESDEDPETVVALERGSVLLESRAKAATPVVLEPGQVSRISGEAGPSAPEQADIEQKTAWRLGGLFFNDTPVGVVVDEIKRRFDVEVEMLPPSLRQERVTLRLSDARDAEFALSMIAMAREYTLRETDGVFSLTMPVHE